MMAAQPVLPRLSDTHVRQMRVTQLQDVLGQFADLGLVAKAEDGVGAPLQQVSNIVDWLRFVLVFKPFVLLEVWPERL